MYRRKFDREKLQQDDGVEYFLKTLKGEYIRDAPRVFMWRFTNFLRVRRHGDDILAWLYKYDLEFTRLQGAWKDLTPYLDPGQPPPQATMQEITQWITNNVSEQDRPNNNPDRIKMYNIRVIEPDHQSKFPFQELVKTSFS